MAPTARGRDDARLRQRLADALGTTPGTWKHLIDRAKHRRLRLARAETDLLKIRGLLSPNGYPRRVPMDLGEHVAPAIKWLLDELERCQGEQVTEWAVRFSGGYTVPRPDRDDALDAIARYRHIDPDAHLVCRTITRSPWRHAEGSEER